MTQSEHVISKFGGIRPLATAIRRSPSTVQGWLERGFIPPRRYEEVLSAARETGVPLSRDDFVAHLEPNGAAA